jgi:ATP-dependent helicase/nuclease subunit A
MIAALERRGIAVAGADRMVLTGQIAVQDILVLCRFLLLPEDDLSLATVLKSPLFGLDDDDLLRLAPRRTGTLWRALLAAVEAEPRYAAIAMQLKRWRARADQVPPFELLIEILDHDGMRERLLARLGTEAADGIDELVAMALAYDEDAPPSLEGFVHAVSESEHEIKRDMEHGRDQVRVLTVHGAKGLEAPIVFLPDTCADVNRGSAIVDLEGVPRQSQTPAPFVWPIAEASRLDAVKASREVRRAREVAESHRLLYVAMTRARDRLYIAGFEGARPVKGCWYELITAGLGNLEEVEGEDGRPVQRLAASQTAAPRKVEQGDATAAGQATLPEWARRRAPAEPMRLVPLAPSRLAPLETDADGDPVARPPRDGLAAAGSGTPDRVEASRDVGPLRTGDVATGDHRFLRGIVTHALLQHLPGVPPERWAATAETFVEARGAGLGARVRRGIVEDTLKLLATPEFASLFGPRSRAEVSIVADLAPPTGRGNTVRLTGQIDRLVELDGHVLVVDYKTNRPAPTRVEDVPEAYVLQLAAYRLALERIYPKRRVEAALLWTDTLHLMPIPAALLDSAAPRLFAPEVALVG